MFPASELFNPESYGAWPRDEERDVDIVSGCFFLIELAFWRELNGFDLRFFMYGEEADLCARAAQRGAKPAVTPAARIIHYGGASEPARAPKVMRLFAGKITLIEKHWSPALRPIGRGLYRIHVLVRRFAFGLAAKLTGREGHVRSAETWREIWRERKTWLGGYPPA